MNADGKELRQTGRWRYPGARPFEDSAEDQEVFRGREGDASRLCEHVIGTRLLVLFGKSGLGKTSLLNTGLFPRLREMDFLPVPVRLNGNDAPAETVIAAFCAACRQPGLRMTEGNRGGLWEFLATSMVWRADLLLTPVLVFDQFEEVFTLRDADFRRQLAAELGALASGVPPRRLLQHGGDRPAELPDLKILLSLREEYLGTLQELSAAIPGLFQERFRLAPLADEDARKAIVEPALQQPGPGQPPFDSPAFAFDASVVDAMLEFLRGESKIIEPFQLQLLCCHAEDIVTARTRARSAAGTAHRGEGEMPVIRLGDMGGVAGMEQVQKRFYERTIARLPRHSRAAARRLCEEGLISAEGRRLMLDGSQIASEFKLPATDLDALVEQRLLRREPRLESLFYEISHDRLAESIVSGRQWQIPHHWRKRLAAVFVSLACLNVLWVIWTLSERERQARELAEIEFAPKLARQALKNPDPRLKLLFGVESLWRVDSADAAAAILAAWDNPAMHLSAPSALGSAKDVVTARFSPDAKHVALGRENGEVEIYEVASDPAAERGGAPPRELPRLSHGHRISQLAFSSDGGHLAVASFGGTVSVWAVDKASGYPRIATIDTSTYFKSEFKSEKPRLTAIAISVGAKALLTVHRDGRGFLWDLASGKAKSEFGVAGPAAAIAFSEESERYFLTAGSASCVEAWDGVHAKAARVSPTPIRASVEAFAGNGNADAERCGKGELPLTSATLSSNGRWVATANKFAVRRFPILSYRSWGGQAAKPETEISASRSPRPTLNPEETGAAISATVEVKEVTDDRSLGGVASNLLQGARFVDVELSASGKYLVSIASYGREHDLAVNGGDLALLVVDVQERVRAFMQLTTRAYAAMTVSPRGDLLALVQDGRAQLWRVGPFDTRTTVAIRPFVVRDPPFMAGGPVSPGSTGASSPQRAGEESFVPAEGLAPMGSTGESGPRRAGGEPSPDRSPSEVLVAALGQANGRAAIVTSLRGQPELVTFDGVDGREITRRAAASGVGALASSPRGDFAAVATLDLAGPKEGAREPLGGLETWAVGKDGKLEERSCRAQLEAATVSRLLLADGGIAAVLTADGKARLLERRATDTGCTMAGRVVISTKARLLALSPDGKWLALVSADDEAFEFWNAESGIKIKRTESGRRPHGEGRITHLSFSRDSGLLATGGSDGQVQLWHWKSATPGSAIALERSGMPRKVPGRVSYLEFGGAVDGAEKWLAIVGHFDPDVVRVERLGRDAEKSIELKLRGESGVKSIGFSSDGRRLVAAGEDGAVRVWTLPDGREILRRTPGRSAIGWLSQVGFIGATRVAGVTDDGTVVVWNSDPREFKEDVDAFLKHRPELTLTDDEWRANVDPRGDHPFKRLVPRPVPDGEKLLPPVTDKRKHEMVMFAIQAHRDEARAVMRSTPAVASLEGRAVTTAAIGIGSLAIKMPEVFKGHEQARDDPEAFARRVDGLSKDLSGLLQELDEIDRDQRLGPARLSEVYKRWDLWPQCGSCHPQK